MVSLATQRLKLREVGPAAHLPTCATRPSMS